MNRIKCTFLRTNPCPTKSHIFLNFHAQDDKYILKHLVVPTSGENREERFNPITKINLILVRQSATEKNAFYFINTTHSQCPMLLELTAPSALECKTYVK